MSAVALSASAVNSDVLTGKVRLPHPLQDGKRVERTPVPQLGRASRKNARLVPTRVADESVKGFWVSKSQTYYFPGEEEGEWKADEKVNITYDASGRLAELVSTELYEDGYVYLTTFEYGEDGKNYNVLTKAGDSLSELENSEKAEFEYDPICRSLLVKAYRYDWNFISDDWDLSPISYYRKVERDDQGNITAVRYYSQYGNDFEEVQRIELEYKDGKISSINEYMLSYDENNQLVWIPGYSYRNIEWYCTNGQVYNFDVIFEDDNKVKSYEEYLDGEFEAYVKVEYVGESNDFVCTALFEEGAQSVQEWYVYPNGGYASDVTVTYNVEGEEKKVEQREREEYDAFGNLLIGYAVVHYDDLYEVLSWEEGSSELNADNLPVVYVQKMFLPEDEWEEGGWEEGGWEEGGWEEGGWEEGGWEEGGWEDGDWTTFRPSRKPALTTPPVAGNWVDNVKIEYGDYEFIQESTGVSSVAEDSLQPAEYYSVDGLRLDPSAAKGLVIRRQGNKVAKILK